MTSFALQAALLGIVTVLAAAIVRQRNLLAATILLSVYGLVMALLWALMQAYDVGFTEAAVGAGVSTVLLVATLARLGREASRERGPPGPNVPALLGCLATGAALIWGTLDMPPVGSPDAPLQRRGPGTDYMAPAPIQGPVPNMVTVLLADYRGYDTMFETAVIFTAGASLILLLRRPAAAGGRPAAPGPAGGRA